MQSSLFPFCSAILIILIGCGQASPPKPLTDSPRPTSGSPKTSFSLRSRPLQLAFDVAITQDDQDPLVMELWSGIGQECAESGDIDSAKHLLKLLEEKSPTAPTLTARGDIATALVMALIKEKRVDEAIAIVDQIPSVASRQQCAAFSAIAIAMDAIERTEELNPFWGEALESVERGIGASQKAENLLVIIQSLVNANRMAEAEALAGGMEQNYSSRRGWRPVAEKAAIDGDNETASRLLHEKLIGLDEDLYLFIKNVLAEHRFRSRFEICWEAQRKIKDPVLSVCGCSLVCDEIAQSSPLEVSRDQRTAARRAMGTAFEKADKAGLSQSATARVLLVAMSPMDALGSKGIGVDFCRIMESKFAPEFAAQGYRQLATLVRPEETEEKIRYLETAEGFAGKVSSPNERVHILRQIYLTRCSFVDEEHALRAAERLTVALDRGYAWLGTGEARAKMR